MEITKSKLYELAQIEPEDELEFGGSVKVRDENVFVTNPKNIKIHKIANILPVMSESEYKMLKHSIELNGQIEPVWLYRGKLVDGRHRLKALKELNSNVIKYMKLPNNWTLEQVKEFILATEQRRHETKAQQAVRAYFEYKKSNETMDTVAIRYGVDKGDISRAKKIEEKLGTDTLKKILNKRKVKLPNGRYYSNLKSIVQYINTIEKKQNEIKSNHEPPNAIAKEAVDLLEKAYATNDIDTITFVITNAKKMLNDMLQN